MRAAAEWYTRCLEANVRGNGEHHWSMLQLSAWAASDRSIERLAQELRKGARAKKPGPAAI